MIGSGRWANIAFAIQVMLKEEAFDLAKEFIDHVRKRKSEATETEEEEAEKQ